MNELEQWFNTTADKWVEETVGYSITTKMYRNQHYKDIITKGIENPDLIVPLIIKRLSTRYGFWFVALRTITGEDPAKDIMDYEEAIKKWVEWGNIHYNAKTPNMKFWQDRKENLKNITPQEEDSTDIIRKMRDNLS